MKRFIIGIILGFLAVGGFAGAYTALDYDIKANGWMQGDVYRFLDNTRLAVNELLSDHATNKTTIDESRTAVIELIDDHATTKTYLDNLKSLVNELRTAYLTRLFSGYPGFAIATNFDIGNSNAFQIAKDGVVYNIAGSQTWDTGTAGNWAADKWAVALLSVDNDATTHLDWSTNAAAGYSSEATAIASIDGVSASGEVVIGYATVLTASGQTFTAGTDALEGGTGGNPSGDTNYYQAINPDATLVGAAISDTLATLTATDPTTSSGALTNSTPLSLLKGQ